jgi:hypothetical protein
MWGMPHVTNFQISTGCKWRTICSETIHDDIQNMNIHTIAQLFCSAPWSTSIKKDRDLFVNTKLPVKLAVAHALPVPATVTANHFWTPFSCLKFACLCTRSACHCHCTRCLPHWEQLLFLPLLLLHTAAVWIFLTVALFSFCLPIHCPWRTHSGRLAATLLPIC